MIATPLGAVASGGGVAAPQLTLLASFKKRKIKTIKNRRLTGICAAGAVDARNQEKAGNLERPAGSRQEPGVVVVAALAPPLPLKVQEPVSKKRGHDSSGETIWASKKQRSSTAAARESGNAIAEAVAAAASSPIVQELAGNWDGGNPICKKDHYLPWGSFGVAMEEKKTEEKLRPCVFASSVHGLDDLRQDLEVTVLDIALPSQGVQKPVERDHHNNGEESCWLIKRSCLATVAVCEGSNGAVDQNRAIASAPSTETQEPTRRSSPMQEAKGAGRRGHKNNHSHRRTRTPIRKTPMRRFMSLSSGLQCLGVADVTPVLAKTLTATDSCSNQSRLQFSPRDVMESPLMSILTPDECSAVNTKDGLALETIDRHGYSYQMRFKYVDSTGQYRLMQEWVLFLTQNGVREGDMVEVGALRAQGRPMLTLLNYAREGWIPEETEAADGLLMLSDFNDGTRS